jgi:hypothetical protein
LKIRQYLAAAIPNSIIPEPKRDQINIPGVLSVGKRGAPPSFFPLTPPQTFSGLFFAEYPLELPQKKEKKGQMNARRQEPGSASFDHFLNSDLLTLPIIRTKGRPEILWSSALQPSPVFDIFYSIKVV